MKYNLVLKFKNKLKKNKFELWDNQEKPNLKSIKILMKSNIQ